MLIEVDERVAQALKTLEAQAAARQMPLAEMLDLVITTTLGVGSVAVRTSFAENHAFFQDQANSPEEPTMTQWMRLGEATLEFWNDPKEDIYSETDGETGMNKGDVCLANFPFTDGSERTSTITTGSSGKEEC